VVFLLSRLLRKPLINRAFGVPLTCSTRVRTPLAMGPPQNLLPGRGVPGGDAQAGRLLPGPPGAQGGVVSELHPDSGPSAGGRRRRSGTLPAADLLGPGVPDQGIEVILESLKWLHPDVSIDLYGPLENGYAADDLNRRGLGRVRYLGVLDEVRVQERLFHYDALVLPTFHPGEGYPGVILEAYAHSVPVIATRWLSLPEIVDDSCGILIEAGDPVAFADAVNRLRAGLELWKALRRGSLERAREFSDRERTEQFVALCETLASTATAGQ